MKPSWLIAACLLTPAVGDAQQVNFIEPFGRTVSASVVRKEFPGTEKGLFVLEEKIEVIPFAATAYVNGDAADAVAVTLGASWKQIQQLELTLVRIDPSGPGSKLDRWGLRYRRQLWPSDPQSSTRVFAFASARDTQALGSDAEAAISLEHDFDSGWFVGSNVGLAQVDAKDAAPERDYLLTAGVGRVLGSWILSLDYGAENKLAADVFTLVAVFKQKLVFALDDDETAAVTFKHVF